MDHRLISEHISFTTVIVATPNLDVKTTTGGTREREREREKEEVGRRYEL